MNALVIPIRKKITKEKTRNPTLIPLNKQHHLEFRIELLEKQVSYLRERLDECYYAPNMPGCELALQEAQKEVSSPYVKEKEWPEGKDELQMVPLMSYDCAMTILESGWKNVEDWVKENKLNLFDQYSVSSNMVKKLAKDKGRFNQNKLTRTNMEKYCSSELKWLRRLYSYIHNKEK